MRVSSGTLADAFRQEYLADDLGAGRSRPHERIEVVAPIDSGRTASDPPGRSCISGAWQLGRCCLRPAVRTRTPTRLQDIPPLLLKATCVPLPKQRQSHRTLVRGLSGLPPRRRTNHHIWCGRAALWSLRHQTACLTSRQRCRHSVLPTPWVPQMPPRMPVRTDAHQREMREENRPAALPRQIRGRWSG